MTTDFSAILRALLERTEERFAELEAEQLKINWFERPPIPQSQQLSRHPHDPHL